MFTEKEMSDALKWLFDLYQPEDYEAYDEEEVGSVALCLPEIRIRTQSTHQNHFIQHPIPFLSAYFSKKPFYR